MQWRVVSKQITFIAILYLLVSAWPLHGQRTTPRTVAFAPKTASWSITDLHGYFHQQTAFVADNGDVLALSSRPSGTWDFYRISGWNTNASKIDHLALAGFPSSKETQDLEDVSVEILGDPEQRYMICVGQAFLNHREKGRSTGDSRTVGVIAVIDQTSFKVVALKPTQTFSQMPFQGVQQDHKGHVVLDGSDSMHGELLQLSVPSLVVTGKCSYDIDRQKGTQTAASSSSESCQLALGGETLEGYLEPPSKYSSNSNYTCQTQIEYCPQPDLVTHDGKFAVGIRNLGHDNVFRNWVQGKRTALIFSVLTHKEIADFPLEGESMPFVAIIQGEDFLLTIEEGSILKAFPLSDK